MTFVRPSSRLGARAAVFLGLLPVSLAAAARAEPIRIVLLSPPTQSTAPGELLPTPFAIRVERANGEPIADMDLTYTVDPQPCPPFPGFPCPPWSEYGVFETGFPMFPSTVLVTTGNDGTATAPPFRAGTPSQLPWVFTVTPYAQAQTTSGGITITSEDAAHPIGGQSASATTVRIEGVAAIPALDGAGAWILAVLLAAAGMWSLRSIATGR